MQFTILFLAAMAVGVFAAPPPKVNKVTANLSFSTFANSLSQYKNRPVASPSKETDAEAKYRTQCEGVSFAAVYPPSQAEQDCQKLQYEAQCANANFIAIFPPSEAQMKCMKLEYKTQCEGKVFTMIYPPSPEQQRCQDLEKSISEDGSSDVPV